VRWSPRFIDKGWRTDNHRSQPETATQVCHSFIASTILPLGSYFSIGFQQYLNAYLTKLENSLSPQVEVYNPSKTNPACCIKTILRSSRRFQLPAHIARDIMLVQKLLVSPLANEILSWTINLFIPRSPHITSFTNTSYEILGGFSIDFNFEWSITSDDLAALGWSVLKADPD